MLGAAGVAAAFLLTCFLVALVSGVAAADPILWIFKGGKSSFPHCPGG